jgi:hypothetical protein
VSDVLGRPIEKKGLSFSGMTDPLVVRELLRVNGVVGAPSCSSARAHHYFVR